MLTGVMVANWDCNSLDSRLQTINQSTLLAAFERRRPTAALVYRPRPEADMKTATLLAYSLLLAPCFVGGWLSVMARIPLRRLPRDVRNKSAKNP